MRDELMYPRAFALMPVPIKMAYNKEKIAAYDDVFCYVVSPCYVVREYVDYSSDGNKEQGTEIVFPRKYLGLWIEKNKEGISGRDLDEIPETKAKDFPFQRPNYSNSVSTDFVTYDYDEALKGRDEKNKELFF